MILQFDLADDSADDVWGILKSFSTITVRNKVASVHRLLQRVVQDTLAPDETDEAISCCLCALSNAWRFQQWDPSTWADAGNLVPHIMVVRCVALRCAAHKKNSESFLSPQFVSHSVTNRHPLVLLC
jgi:hypothetical protein